MLTSRAKTAEEVCSEFVNHIHTMAIYWATLPDKTPQERCDGVAFSILVMIDGESNLPAINLSLSPHPDDKAYCMEQEENWYEPGQVMNADCSLHELFFEK